MTAIAARPRLSPLTERQLGKIREQLASDREQIERLITSIQVDMGAFVNARRDAATDDESDPEGPTLAFERSQSSAMLTQSVGHLGEIDAALARMDDGVYGLCTTCNGPIALGRLQARPQASLCIECAARVR
jgi:DnaK suppressor protein